MDKERLKKAIAYGGSNQSRLAESIGITRAAFCNRLDKMRFSEDELNLIAKAVGAKYLEYFEFPDGTKI